MTRVQALSSAFVRRVTFPLWALRDHPYYYLYERESENAQFLPRLQLEELQLTRLQALLKHAYSECPFYRDRMNAAGLKPERISAVADIASLPPLTKRDIQDHAIDICASSFDPSERARNQTGGSTGSPLQFWVDRKRLDSRLASTMRHNGWTGLRAGDWCAEIWGNRLDQHLSESLWSRTRNALLYRTLELNTSSFGDADFSAYVERLRRHRPQFLVAYAKAAAFFARWIRDNGVKDIRFDAVITTAEVLTPNDRADIEDVFRARVFNRYGCREVSVIASECEKHAGLHVNADMLLVEIVRVPEYPAPFGKVLITDLLNYSMPLIRYEIGDVSAWATQQNCACGRSLPMLSEVHGRVTDFISLRDGRFVSGPALTLVVSDMPEVRQVQFVQQNQDHITLRVVRGEGYDHSTTAELQRRLAPYLNGAAQIDIQHVDQIKAEASGKYRFVISDYSREGAHQAGAN